MQFKPPRGFAQKDPNLFMRTGRRIPPFVASLAKRRLIPFFLCLLLIGVHTRFLTISSFERVEHFFVDHFFRIRHPLPNHPAIVIIEIAEDSIQALGRWPWPRHFHAVMVHLLSEWGVKAIVFDVIFSEPSTAFDDGAFEEAIRKSGRVYLPVILEPQAEEKIWIRSLPSLESHAKAVGHINVTPDPDGIIRRIRPFLEYEEKKFPHLALQVAFDNLGREVPDFQNPPFPLDSKGNLLVNWAGRWKETFQHYSYLDLLRSFEALQAGKEPLISPERIRGKICLIGLTATALSDIKPIPLESAYPSVGVNANVINSLLTQRFIKPASLGTNLLCLLGIGLLASSFFVLFPNIVSLLAAIALAAVWLQTSFFIFQQKAILLSIFYPLLLIFSLFIFSAFYALIIARKEQQRFFDLATRDGLTGLYVIRYFREVMNETVKEARLRKQPLSLIILDIDHFKEINDTYGHPAGDSILKAMASLLTEHTRHLPSKRAIDVTARYGGEEFILLLRNCKLHQAAFGVAERLRRIVSEHPFRWGSLTLHLTISLGVSTLHVGENVPDLMIRRADAALYRAKREGRNRVCLESETSAG